MRSWISRATDQSYAEGQVLGREEAIEEVIRIFNEIEDSGIGFRYDKRDIREYLLARLGVKEEEWPFYLDGRVMMTEEEHLKLPQI